MAEFRRESVRPALHNSSEQDRPRACAPLIMARAMMERLAMQRRADLDFSGADLGSDTIIVYAPDRAVWDICNDV